MGGINNTLHDSYYANAITLEIIILIRFRVRGNNILYIFPPAAEFGLGRAPFPLPLPPP